jgi:hypothetical protein
LEGTGAGDDDYDNNGVIELPEIKMIWDCEKIEKFGSKNKKDEGRIWHWCDSDYRVWNATKPLRHVTVAPEHNMRVRVVNIPYLYKVGYLFLLEMKANKVAVTVQSKDHIDNDLEEENFDLAHKIAGIAKKRKTLGAYFGAKMHQLTPYDCTPPYKWIVIDDEMVFDYEEKVGNAAARLNATITDRVHAHGLPFILSETVCFHRVI